MRSSGSPYSLRFWETCTNREKLVFLSGLRYAVGISILLIVAYAEFEKWRLERLIKLPGFHITWITAPIEETRFALLVVLVILIYNTLGALLMNRVGILALASGLSLLDLAAALVGVSLALPTAGSSTFSAIFSTMLLSNLLFLGLPALAVLFGRVASLFAILLFFAAEGYLYLFEPKVSAQIPALVAFTPMAFFTLLTYIVGHISEVEQSYQHKAETLGLQEKSLRLEREVLVEELERANDLKRQFLAFASHELRTPLHAMKGYTSFLLEGMDGALNSEQSRDVEKISSNSDYLLTLINDFLDLTKIEAGRLELNKDEMSMEECVREASDSAAPLCKEKSIEFTVNVQPDLPVIKGDFVRLKQVLINLLGNAVKFTDKGGITLSASVQGESILIEVTDTGSGIPREILPRVFDEYHQWNVSTNRRYGGSGLGLAIAKRLVELHDGTISAVSEIGKGSRFFVRLPAG